jgi:hypothetical protein
MIEGILKNAAACRKARADDRSSIVSFCRDDSSPRMKKAWDKKVATANKYNDHQKSVRFERGELGRISEES